jgi:cytochrome c oxidase subunit 2
MVRKQVLVTAALAALVAPVATASADEARGAQVFQLCAQCHGADGGGDPQALAPAIAGLAEWYVVAQLRHFRSGARGTNPNDVAGLRMHPMSLSLHTDSDLEAVAAYVANLPTVDPERLVDGGDAEKGAITYKLCVQCHGENGQGNQQLNSPRLAPASDWYLLSSLERYKAGIRGTNPQNANAVLMRGMSLSLADQQAMKDVIAYIETLGN